MLWYCFYVSSFVTDFLYSTKLNVNLCSAAMVYLLMTINTFLTMMGMALDNIQRTTWTPLTTSLAKTGSQKSELLDSFSSVTTPNDYPTQMTPTKMTPPVKPPSIFPARPSPNASSPSKASIAGATARLKKLVQPTTCTKPNLDLELLPGILCSGNDKKTGAHKTE